MESSTKIIGRNREPRVHIGYDVEKGDAEERKELPFVMAVLSDLSGKTTDTVPPVEKRAFQEFDIDNFGQRMAAMKPSVAFPVKNTLTGEDNLMVSLTFKSMDDFGPGAIARNVPELNALLEVRNQLDRLKLMLDGRGGAEKMLTEALRNPALLKSLAAGGNAANDAHRDAPGDAAPAGAPEAQ
ncbi:type VI secretion system contractile sheath small subunit [Caballeronia sp. BR00000012568055]|uniref:type VI secretion system contractile sheath small subunit n=1 Tax=Caballeronia sp. BR00000012568055 TaxID=2918761 RepID=UPI0023F9D2D7|nr:type VI secretion system contractile sheath small subunit [Caballeronia sp. BR00000012568055]